MVTRFALLLACASMPAVADVALAPVFQDRAVLQRDKPLPVWGSAGPGEKITVTYEAPTRTRSAETVADTAGRWLATLDPLPAETAPGTLVVSGKNKLVRTDILVGDVWLASGQSNMEFALGWGARVLNAKEEIAAADFPLIRQFKIKNVVADSPRDTLPGEWRAATSKSVVNFSAVAYFFARELHRKLGIPVGIINGTWGGTQIQAWMPSAVLASDPAGPAVQKRWAETLAAYPARKAAYDEAKAAWDAGKTAAKASGLAFSKQPPFAPNGPGGLHTPSGLYNAMIHPLAPCALRGIIWYQGESNAGRADEYRTLFPSLIRGWRAAFGQGDLPFYWVQLANYAGSNARGTDWAEIREAQAGALSLPATGQAVAIDIGESGNVHPANKQEAGRRLALLALARAYGDRGTADSGPAFVGFASEADGSVRIRFSNTESGLVNAAGPDSPVAGFELAGPDRVFHPADAARIEGSSVVLRSSAVPAPSAVRYAWRNDPKASLANGAGLPAAPFRTDDWK